MTIAATDKLLFNVNLGYLDTGYDEITVPTGPSAGTSRARPSSPKRRRRRSTSGSSTMRP